MMTSNVISPQKALNKTAEESEELDSTADTQVLYVIVRLAPEIVYLLK